LLALEVLARVADLAVDLVAALLELVALAPELVHVTAELALVFVKSFYVFHTGDLPGRCGPQTA
jgi:hypothetical protein